MPKHLNETAGPGQYSGRYVASRLLARERKHEANPRLANMNGRFTRRHASDSHGGHGP